MAMQAAIRLDTSCFDYQAILKSKSTVQPEYVTDLGALFAGDCMELLSQTRSGVVDTVFADPPFNIGKEYGVSYIDSQPDARYLSWCKEWLAECVRVLRPGGALFVYNLPKWNILLGAHLTYLKMEFRHWIAIEMSASLPISGRLHPSHYSLLYYTKGKPNTFRKLRTPIQTCRHCGKEIKDYGGHRDAMNPLGVNLKDVWSDIPSVRHWKFKSKDRRANALSTKLLERVVEVSTKPGDLVLDPFGGSGTTFAVCERKDRHWIGSEIDFAQAIIDRLQDPTMHFHRNDDFVEG